MCGRYELHTPVETIMRAFDINETGLYLSPRYNIAPTQSVPIVLNQENERRLRLARWGLIPGWAKAPHTGRSMINARAETLAVKKTFRGLLVSSRCIVLADGFYEWKRLGNRKVPMYITLKHRHPFGFAGLYSTFKSPEGENMLTCTIVTTAANELVGEVHDRMPAILAKKDEGAWLDPGRAHQGELISLLAAYPGNEIEMYEVSPLVNKPSNDSPENIRRVG
jgi:putative SOS response-associated peptidase YedK